VGEMLLTAIADSGTQVKNGYKDNNIKFELDVKEDILVEADRNRVNQVISNLLNNAIKFTKQEGIISMKAEKKDNEVIISVKDNGRGIDPQIIATKSDTGTGLGLFISKSIVEAQGGRIRAEK
jgi:signal transduction histidine kinase